MEQPTYFLWRAGAIDLRHSVEVAVCYRPCNPTINSLFSFLFGVGVILFPFNRASPSNGEDIKENLSL